MGCSGTCTITKYETKWSYIAEPIAAGSDCDIWDKDDIRKKANAHVESFLANKYPDTATDCEKGCKCIEIEDQDPRPTKWIGWIKHADNFPMDPPLFKCRVGYTIMYKYRVRLFEGLCGIEPGETYGDPNKDEPSEKLTLNYDPKYHDKIKGETKESLESNISNVDANDYEFSTDHAHIKNVGGLSKKNCGC